AKARNCGPFAASRTAAVAMLRTSLIRMVSQSTRNRCSAASALATPSSGNSPLVATPLPRPHNAFSLKVGVGARECDSYATSRTEFEPISTIATGTPGNRPCAELSDIVDPLANVARRPPLYQARQRNAIGNDSFSAWPRPDRLGFVRKYLWALNGSSPGAGWIRSLEPSGKIRKLCWLSIRLASMI